MIQFVNTLNSKTFNSVYVLIGQEFCAFYERTARSVIDVQKSSIGFCAESVESSPHMRTVFPLRSVLTFLSHMHHGIAQRIFLVYLPERVNYLISLCALPVSSIDLTIPALLIKRFELF